MKQDTYVWDYRITQESKSAKEDEVKLWLAWGANQIVPYVPYRTDKTCATATFVLSFVIKPKTLRSKFNDDDEDEYDDDEDKYEDDDGNEYDITET